MTLTAKKVWKQGSSPSLPDPKAHAPNHCTLLWPVILRVTQPWDRPHQWPSDPTQPQRRNLRIHKCFRLKKKKKPSFDCNQSNEPQKFSMAHSKSIGENTNIGWGSGLREARKMGKKWKWGTQGKPSHWIPIELWNPLLRELRGLFSG